MKKIALFASGNGTNAENICEFFKDSSLASVSILFSNNKKSLVVSRLKKYGVQTHVFSKSELENPGPIKSYLLDLNIDLIVLCGFLLKIPSYIIDLFPNRIINIHPSLLPKYGGRGMYGDHVHKSVLENKELFSGITIHFVNERYDKGKIILQKKVAVSKKETVESLSKKIHSLEKEFLPKTIKSVLVS